MANKNIESVMKMPNGKLMLCFRPYKGKLLSDFDCDCRKLLKGEEIIVKVTPGDTWFKLFCECFLCINSHATNGVDFEFVVENSEHVEMN